MAVLAVAGPLPTAGAAPPGNDWPHLAGVFEPYTAENGTPDAQQAIAELVEAGPEPGTPRCLGERSFARTVWFRTPPAETFQEVSIEAIGRTLDVLDLAAFIQPEGATSPLVDMPNACSGEGSTGSAAAEEPTAAVTLRVPPRRSVLIQVGRRGARGTPDDERALLSLETRPSFFAAGPAGDLADRSTPPARTKQTTTLALGGATTTEEDPAQPACPALASVWRRVVPSTSGSRLITANGRGVSTLTVFSGTRPTLYNALDCVNRGGYGPLQMRVRVRKRRPLWIRVGSDTPVDSAEAKLRVEPTERAVVIDGGPGGFDPTTGGPGGGLPQACENADLDRARVSGAGIRGQARSLNRRATIALRIKTRRSVVCDVTLLLRGPRGRVYAEGRRVWLQKGRRATVRLRRVRRLVRGQYRLRVSGRSELGVQEPVRTRVRGRLVR
jgi:hypothetical protein